MVAKKSIGETTITKVKGTGKTRYELLAIYPLGVNEIAAEKSLADACKSSGFSILEVDKWGVKNLAYDINKESKGYYIRFEIKEGVVRDLENALKIDDNILRYIVVKI